MIDSFPLPFLHLLFNRSLLCPLPEVFVGDLFWPSNVEDAAVASVDESLQLVGVSLCGAPYLLYLSTFRINYLGTS